MGKSRFDWADEFVLDVEELHGLTFRSKVRLFSFTDEFASSPQRLVSLAAAGP